MRNMRATTAYLLSICAPEETERVPKRAAVARKRSKGKQSKKPTNKERVERARAKITENLGPIGIEGCDPATAKVFSEPFRVQIVMTATARKLSAKGFAEEWDIPDYSAHYQFQVLRDRKFIKIVGEERRRGAMEIFYRAEKRVFIPDSEWAGLSAVFKSSISHAIAEELWLTLAQAAEADTLDARDESILWWQEVPLDEITFPKAMAMQRLLIERLVELGGETAQNQADGKGGKSFPGVFAIMGFEGAPERRPVKRRRRKVKPDRKRRKRNGK